jgi:hypothetical protein
VRVLRPVVETLVLPVLNAGRDLLLRGLIASQLICDQDPWWAALPLQQLSEQAFGGPFVPPALHQDVEHDAVLVHRAPQPVLLAGDLGDDLIQMPLVACARQPTADPIGDVLAELQRPLSYGLVADDDAACGQHLLDHAQAEREAEIQPNRVADDLGRKPVAGVAGGGRRCHPVRLRDLARHGKPPT